LAKPSFVCLKSIAEENFQNVPKQLESSLIEVYNIHQNWLLYTLKNFGVDLVCDFEQSDGPFFEFQPWQGMLLKGLIDHVLVILSYRIPKLDKILNCYPIGAWCFAFGHAFKYQFQFI
jgi:hypothetical protein